MFLLLHDDTLPLSPLLLGFGPATVLLLMPLLLLAPGGLLVLLLLLLLDAGLLSKLVTESVDRHSSRDSYTRCSSTGSVSLQP
jgi:hypothetical protein